MNYMIVALVLSTRAGSGHFFSGLGHFVSGPGCASVFWLRATEFGLFLAIFLTDFSARRQFLMFGLDQATQNRTQNGLGHSKPKARLALFLIPCAHCAMSERSLDEHRPLPWPSID